MRRVEIAQAVADVGHDHLESAARHEHARAAHAEVLVGVEREHAELLLVAEARLADEVRLARVERAQEQLELVGLDVDVVVHAHEPLELVYVVVVHELEHHEGLLLRRIRVVHARQRDQRQIVGARRAGARKERHLARYELTPRGVHAFGARVQVLLSRHHADEHQALTFVDRLENGDGRHRLVIVVVVVVVVVALVREKLGRLVKDTTRRELTLDDQRVVDEKGDR